MSSASPPVGQRSGPEPFDPAAHAVELTAIVRELRAVDQPDGPAIDRILRRHPRGGRALFSRSQLIAGVRAAVGRGLAPDEAERLVALLRRRRVRTHSGVAPVTVLTKPFPCPGRCSYCPTDVRMPRSYLADEPGAQRATQNRFDPFLQTRERVRAFAALGHAVDKVELIALGGTASAYPERYRVWFAKRCLDALNDPDARDAVLCQQDFADVRPEPDPARPGGYDRAVRRHLRQRSGGGLLEPWEAASWADLEAAQRRNEDAARRCVGSSFETRPDQIDAAELLRLRRLGATKLQVGVQSLSDTVLRRIERGHDVARTRRALADLRAAGFKLQIHWMPNLPGATPESDLAEFVQLFADPDFRPDEIKLYPTVLVHGTALADEHRAGTWRPYDDATLADLLAACLERAPRYCRVTRVIRDISAHDIAAGTRVANLREVAERRLAERGARSRDIRAREVRERAPDVGDVQLLERRYASSIGEELFLEARAPGDRIAGFARLSLPRAAGPIAELGDGAILREVHVYGEATPLGRRGAGTQHRGLGRALIERALRCARAAGHARCAVISAVGTRRYYDALGFERGDLYQHRSL